jgi:hypothetical protein
LDSRPRPGLWAPLDLDEANTLLREGGYGLRLECARPGSLKLVGRGAGVGLPLGDEPTWTDLYGALVRLRRTRRRHDPGWLHQLSRLVEGGQSRPEKTVRWVRLPPRRVECLTAAKAELSDTVTALTTEDGSVLFPSDLVGAVPEETGLVADGRNARMTVGRATDSGTVDWVTQLQSETRGVPLNREHARRQVHGWSQLASAVASDPVLRMHCATQPVPAALIDNRTGAAVLAREAEPVPPHPRHPGGTVAASLPALLRSGPDATPALLRQVVENRFERRENELGYFLEHFVRPLLRAFRLALDTHRIGLYSLDEAGVGFELSPELEATGRVVVTDYGGLRTLEGPNVTDTNAADVRVGVEALAGTLDALSAAFSHIAFDGGDHPEGRVRSAVDQVTAEELRYLETHTAELLSREQPLRCFVHTVAPAQDEVLKGVLHNVQERTRYRRRNPSASRPTVVIGLDMCGIVPRERILDAARAVARPRPGAPEGILELARPTSLCVLPSVTESSWRNFVDTSGLAAKYPLVDWWDVHAEFSRAFGLTNETVRADAVTAGLARFVWDVQDAGGQVVFCSSRRERAHGHTRQVLAAAGVPDSLLLCLPDDRTRSISELKVEALRELGDLDVVAVFEDVLANRIAVTKEFSGALAIAVEAPGLATEHAPGQPVPDGAPVIGTFETSPKPSRTRRALAGPRLSNTHSLEELQIGALRSNRSANRWGVELTEGESMALVEAIVSDVDRAAERTVRGIRAKFGLDQNVDAGEQPDRILQALHHVFTRKQFLKGSRSNYSREDVQRDALPFVRCDQPIEVVLLGFPVKQYLNRLKALGPLPDIAELGGLARLRELEQTVRGIYPPGLHFNILTDGRHFRSRPTAVIEAYGKKLREYSHLVGIEECTSIEDIDAVAMRRRGCGLPGERSRRIAGHRKLLADALRGLDIANNPLRTLESVHHRASEVDDSEPGLGPTLRLFREMLMSVVYSVPLPLPAGSERIAWSQQVYADLYNLSDHTVSPEVRQARVAVLRRAWHTVIRYLATLWVDEELEYDDLFPNRVRLTVSTARRGRCGFTYLGGSGLLPWQGTGVVDPRGILAVDFAVSMLDQGFVPVYSPLLGPRQPWLMVAAQHTRWGGGDAVPPGMLLDQTLVERTRLRRK